MNRSDSGSTGPTHAGPLYSSVAQKNLQKFNKYLTNNASKNLPAPMNPKSCAIVDLGIEDTKREANSTAPLPKSPSTNKKVKPPNDQQTFNVILAHIAKRQKTIRNQTLWQNLLRTDNDSVVLGISEAKHRNPSQQSVERSASKKRGIKTKSSTKQSLD